MSVRTRLISLILLPLLAGSLVIGTCTWLWARHEVERRANHYGAEIARQLAITVTDPLLQRDELSLNVILSDLFNRGDIAVVSVYGADDTLVAQVGRSDDDLVLFSDDVTFRDSAAGYVQIGLARSDLYRSLAPILLIPVGIVLAIAVLLGAAVWYYGDLVYLWLGGHRRAPVEPAEEPETVMAPEEEPAPPPASNSTDTTLTILVVKIRPARYIDANREVITNALALYGGDAEITDGDDIVVAFDGDDQLIKAVSCARLIKVLMERARGNITVQCGMHSCDEEAAEADVSRARKHASYLSSITRDRLLASRRVFDQSRGNASLVFQPYHGSLTPDGEVWQLDSINEANRRLIDKQADQLL